MYGRPRARRIHTARHGALRGDRAGSLRVDDAGPHNPGSLHHMDPRDERRAALAALLSNPLEALEGPQPQEQAPERTRPEHAA